MSSTTDPPSAGSSPDGPSSEAHRPALQERWWDTPTTPATQVRAVAYYRHSAQDKQKNSVEIQMQQVQEWAKANRIEIIHEFADRGKSGLTADGRPAFTDMMDLVRTARDFTRVLVLDVSRWGRFQDLDLSASYSAECKTHGKEVVYVNLGIENDGSPVYPLMVGFERWRSAQYSRELSDKVHRGSIKVAEQGYRAGGAAPYATHRVMVNEEDVPQKVLEPGEHKAISDWRVKLAPGEGQQVAVIQDIFHLFVEESLDERQISGRLNQRCISAPGGGAWSPQAVRRLLANRTYAGATVYNRASSKLKGPRRRNPPSEWVITDHAYEAIIPLEIFERAQIRFAERQSRIGTNEMLERLRAIYTKHGVLTEALVAADGVLPSLASVTRHFGGVAGTLHQMYAEVQDRTRLDVQTRIAALHDLVEPHLDFLVINRRVTVIIQPALPMTGCASPSWLFRPDHRPVVDITIGVPLADRHSGEILGYLAMPRLMMPTGWLRLSGANTGLITLHGYKGLDFLQEYLQ
ncbi:MAG: recombinase family protein [Planctomycetes bacterium]|nr:recombinase family protein [Planctomycetota bacterium]